MQSLDPTFSQHIFFKVKIVEFQQYLESSLEMHSNTPGADAVSCEFETKILFFLFFFWHNKIKSR